MGEGECRVKEEKVGVTVKVGVRGRIGGRIGGREDVRV